MSETQSYPYEMRLEPIDEKDVVEGRLLIDLDERTVDLVVPKGIMSGL